MLSLADYVGRVLVFLVEFPVVLLNTANGEIEAEFHHYVQPQENPTLSDFCRELTGITQVLLRVNAKLGHAGDSLLVVLGGIGSG